MITFLDEYLDDTGKDLLEVGVATEDLTTTLTDQLSDLGILTTREVEDLLSFEPTRLSSFTMGKIVLGVRFLQSPDGSDLANSFDGFTQSLVGRMRGAMVMTIAAQLGNYLKAYKPNKTTAREFAHVTTGDIKISDVLDPHNKYYFELPRNSLVLHTENMEPEILDVRAIMLSFNTESNKWTGIFVTHTGHFMHCGVEAPWDEDIFNMVTALMLHYQMYDEDDFTTLPTMTSTVPTNRKARIRKEKLRRQSSMFYVKVMRQNIAKRITARHYTKQREHMQSTMSWYVKGFIRNQRYGENRWKVKQIWIEGHWRGHGIKLTPLKVG